jgi:hypothetical protein
MIRRILGFAALLLVTGAIFAQSTGGFKFPKNPDDYCRDNPKMPTCIKMAPIPPGVLTGVPAGKPTPGAGGGAPAQPRQSRPMSSAPAYSGPVSAVALHDWRFSHSSPGMLININIKSLLQSPIWNVMFGSLLQEADLDKARAALGDIGQILVSMSPNHTSSPSVLMLAKGNVDSALGAMLRSSAGMQAKRLDEYTLLVGDPSSMEMVDLRINNRFPRTTYNALQQTATVESQKYDIWIGADPRNLGSMASMFGASSQAAQAMSILRGVSMGIYVRDQIRVEIGIEAPSPDAAQKMLAAYQQEEARKKNGEKDAFAGQTWVSAQGSKLQFIGIADLTELKTDPEFQAMLSKLIGPQVGPALQALAARGASPRPASEAPKTQPGVIMIQGLDAGSPKQLPVK